MHSVFTICITHELSRPLVCMGFKIILHQNNLLFPFSCGLSEAASYRPSWTQSWLTKSGQTQFLRHHELLVKHRKGRTHGIPAASNKLPLTFHSQHLGVPVETFLQPMGFERERERETFKWIQVILMNTSESYEHIPLLKFTKLLFQLSATKSEHKERWSANCFHVGGSKGGPTRPGILHLAFEGGAKSPPIVVAKLNTLIVQ